MPPGYQKADHTSNWNHVTTKNKCYSMKPFCESLRVTLQSNIAMIQFIKISSAIFNSIRKLYSIQIVHFYHFERVYIKYALKAKFVVHSFTSKVEIITKPYTLAADRKHGEVYCNFNILKSKIYTKYLHSLSWIY